jgi:hypothetical protein
MREKFEDDFLSVYEGLKASRSEDYFDTMTEALHQYFEGIWYKCSDKIEIDFYSIYSANEKEENKYQTELFLNSLVKELQSLDDDSSNKVTKTEIKRIATSFIYSNQFFNFNISKSYPYDFIKTTKYFINNAIKYDEGFNFYDIFQALRNVWTMNILQSAADIEVKLTYPIFGYSMLYPYTDNLLDTTYLTLEEKHLFSNRLKRRLAGEMVFPLSIYEEKVFRLIDLIEETYPRKNHYALYKSLQYIHLAQTESLSQYSSKSNIELEEIVKVSFKKGGLSVLTDFYLTKGELNLKEIIFSFGLGIVLQLIDDLQDIKADMRYNNKTIFTCFRDKHYLDETTSKLLNFISEVINIIPRQNKYYVDHITKALKQNCILMALFATSRIPTLYTRDFAENLQKYYPYPAAYMKNFNSQINVKCSKIKKLKKIQATDILDLLL